MVAANVIVPFSGSKQWAMGGKRPIAYMPLPLAVMQKKTQLFLNILTTLDKAIQKNKDEN